VGFHSPTDIVRLVTNVISGTDTSSLRASGGNIHGATTNARVDVRTFLLQKLEVAR